MGEKQNLPAIPTRTVTVYSSQEGTAYEYETSVRTFGELKQLTPTRVKNRNSGEQPGTRPISFDQKVVRVRDTRVTLEIDSAMLPDGNCTIFTFPQKSKAGAYKKGEANDLGYNEVRSYANILNKKYDANIAINGRSKEQLRADVDNALYGNKLSLMELNPEQSNAGAVSKRTPKKKKEAPIRSQVATKKSKGIETLAGTYHAPVQGKGEKAGIIESLKSKAMSKDTPHLTVLHQILTQQKQTNQLLERLVNVASHDKVSNRISEQLAESKEVQEQTDVVLKVDREEEQAQPVITESDEELEARLREEARLKEENEERERKRKEDDERRQREAEEEERKRKEKEEEKQRIANQLSEFEEDIDDDMLQGTRGR